MRALIYADRPILSLFQKVWDLFRKKVMMVTERSDLYFMFFTGRGWGGGMALLVLLDPLL